MAKLWKWWIGIGLVLIAAVLVTASLLLGDSTDPPGTHYELDQIVVFDGGAGCAPPARC